MPTRTPTTPHASQKEAAPKRVVTPPAAQKASVPANEVSTIDLQQVAADPRTARPAEILMLQRKCGNQAVTHLIQAKPQLGPASASGARAAEQASAAPALQEEVQHPNENGLPPDLKTSIETLAGFALDDVQVHRNSQQPAKFRAYAYAQGAEIHLGPGQEDQLPHEAWHIVQQKQGRVPSTSQARGAQINDNQDLEGEADSMGAKAASLLSGSAPTGLGPQATPSAATDQINSQRQANLPPSTSVVQLYSVTGKWVQFAFDCDHVNECRLKIGETAFQCFLKLQTEQLAHFIDFFRKQPFPIKSPQEQCDLLVPLVGTPKLLALMTDVLTKTNLDPTLAAAIYKLLAPLVDAPTEVDLMYEALTLTKNNVTAAPAIKAYLLKYQKKGDKALAAAREKLKAKGHDPVAADQIMTETEAYNYHESVKSQVESLGHQKATDEYTVAVEDNKKKRETYLTSYLASLRDQTGIDLAQSDETLAKALGSKKAAQDLADFDAKLLKETGVKYPHTFTKREVTKPTKIKMGLTAMFPDEDISDAHKVNTLIAARREKLGGSKATETQVANELGEFVTKRSQLDTRLETNKAKYKTALREAITPLFAFPESEAAAGWVLTTVGADAKKATKLVTWLVTGLTAKLTLTDLQKIFKVFSLDQIEGFYEPDEETDTKAQALLQLLNVAKPGEADKYETLIERDEEKDFTELLAFLKKPKNDIDHALAIFSKEDSSKNVNKLLSDLTQPTITDPLKESEDYLKHKGKAADASFLVAGKVPKADAEQLLAKDWIVGQGESVAYIYNHSGKKVDQTIEVLDILKAATKPKKPAEVKKWLEFNHTFTNIYNKLKADKNQQFWAGETCEEDKLPLVKRTGQADDVDAIVNTSSYDKTVGEFYSGGGFGNLGNATGEVGMVLPDNVWYTEYDIKPYKDDPSRGTRRIVVGGSNYYYTADHYKTFARFRS